MGLQSKQNTLANKTSDIALASQLVVVLDPLEQPGSPQAQPSLQREAHRDADHEADGADLCASRQRHDPAAIQHITKCMSVTKKRTVSIDSGVTVEIKIQKIRLES